MKRIRFGVFSEGHIKIALNKLHNAGVSLSLYEQARRAISSDKQGYYILDTGTVGASRLITLAQKEYKSQLPKADPQTSGKNVFVCAVCGWEGKGTGRDGALVEGDRCPKCGVNL